MFVGASVTFRVDLSIIPWIAELMWKRKRFTQSTKYDLRSFGGELTTIRNAGGVSADGRGNPQQAEVQDRIEVEPICTSRCRCGHFRWWLFRLSRNSCPETPGQT
jgi:hypothetical protein